MIAARHAAAVNFPVKKRVDIHSRAAAVEIAAAADRCKYWLWAVLKAFRRAGTGVAKL
jgi:hypothetical protein